MKTEAMFQTCETMAISPLQIVIYGSSLFLSAMAALLEPAPDVNLLTLPAEAHLDDILRHGPDVVLYQSDRPPVYLDALLASGVCCGELNTHYSSIVVRRDRRTQETHSLCCISDLIAIIAAKE
jgi:hypothetical protein